ncbi:hypothetical protein K402DRAFT_29393 [Aulographum hederae CBS 113979]|uniref:CCHC-type domain-containing protein n=1 Tax=Aulographum hederae CBS 113979 TaxID=1176131 RepID=A0A6G1GI98_9PEZI|nr:hypothetical protein K402DRAFT_29393 [Aulographum hederae CBS 113979]
MVRMLHRILEQRSNAREMINGTDEERSTGYKVNEAQFSIEKRPETERARVPEVNPESYRSNVAEGMGRGIGNPMPRENRFQQPRLVEGSASFNQEVDRLAGLFEQMRVSAGGVLSSDFVQKGIQSYDEMEPARKNMSVAAAVLKRIELLSAGSSGAAAQFTSYNVAAGGYDKRGANGQTLFNPTTGKRGGRGGGGNYKCWMCGDYAHFQPECPWIQEPTVKRYLVWNTAERKFQHARTGEYVPGYHFRPANTKWEGLMEYLAEDNIAIPSEADMRADERYTQRVQPHSGAANQSQSAPQQPGPTMTVSSIGVDDSFDLGDDGMEAGSDEENGPQAMKSRDRVVQAMAIGENSRLAQIPADKRKVIGSRVEKKKVEKAPATIRNLRAGDYVRRNEVPGLPRSNEVPDTQFTSVTMQGEEELEEGEIDERPTVPKPRRVRVNNFEALNRQYPDLPVAQKLMDTLVEVPLAWALSHNDLTKAYFSKGLPVELAPPDLVEEKERQREERREKATRKKNAPGNHFQVSSMGISESDEDVEYFQVSAVSVGPSDPDALDDAIEDFLVNKIAVADTRDLTAAQLDNYDSSQDVWRYRYACPTLTATIHGWEVEGLLDTGAEINVISWEVAMKTRLVIDMLPKEVRHANLVTANGSKQGFEGLAVQVPIRIGGMLVPTEFLVLKGLSHHVIFGQQFLCRTTSRLQSYPDGSVFATFRSLDGTKSVSCQAAGPFLNSRKTPQDTITDVTLEEEKE